MKHLIEKNDRGYNYTEWRHGSHDSRTTRLWIGDIPLVRSDDGREYVEFPVVGAKVEKTQKGAIVLRPGKGTVHYYRVQSGYRGSASAEVEHGGEIVASFRQFHSPQGSLGETFVAVINGGEKEPVLVRWHRTGRRVEKETGLVLLTPDGEAEEVIDDPEVCELLA